MSTSLKQARESIPLPDRAGEVRGKVSRIIFGALILATTNAVWAEEAEDGPPGRTASLGWVRLEGAESCVGLRELAREIESRLGRQAIVSISQAHISIEGRIEQLEPPAVGWRATLAAFDADGEPLEMRSVTGGANGECGAINDELVLAITAMIEPPPPLEETEPSAADARAEQPEEAPPQQAQTQTSPEEAGQEERLSGQPPTEETTRELQTESEGEEEDEYDEYDVVVYERETEGEAGGEAEGESEAGGEELEEEEEQTEQEYVFTANFVGGMGFLPGAPIGASLSFVVDPIGFWPIELELGGIFYSKAEVEEGGAARFYQAHGGAFVCAPLTIRNVPFRACFGAIVGGIHYSGQDFFTNYEDWRLIVHAAGRIWAMWSPGESAFLFRIGVTVLVPIMQDRFVFIDQRGATQVLAEPDVVGASFELGIGTRF